MLVHDKKHAYHKVTVTTYAEKPMQVNYEGETMEKREDGTIERLTGNRGEEEVRRGGRKKPTRKKLRTRKKAKTGRETV